MLVFCGLLIFLSLTSGHNTSSNIASKLVRYYDGSGLLIGFVAWDKEKNTTNQPIILVVPDYNGRDEFENSKAVALAKLGYIGFAVDLYGNGSMGSSHNESIQMMTTYTKDRNKLLSRLRAAISATNSLHDGQHRLGSTNIGAIGFCFGGMAVLDMARSGMPIKSVVSFHGILTPIANSSFSGNITTKVMVHNGYKDPFVNQESINEFQAEMRARNADWLLVQHGTAYHSFTNPHAHWPGKAEYDRDADLRSWQAMKLFFKQTFQHDS